jgi:hypothetical protein
VLADSPRVGSAQEPGRSSSDRGMRRTAEAGALRRAALAGPSMGSSAVTFSGSPVGRAGRVHAGAPGLEGLQGGSSDRRAHDRRAAPPKKEDVRPTRNRTSSFEPPSGTPGPFTRPGHAWRRLLAARSATTPGEQRHRQHRYEAEGAPTRLRRAGRAAAAATARGSAAGPRVGSARVGGACVGSAGPGGDRRVLAARGRIAAVGRAGIAVVAVGRGARRAHAGRRARLVAVARVAVVAVARRSAGLALGDHRVHAARGGIAGVGGAAVLVVAGHRRAGAAGARRTALAGGASVGVVTRGSVRTKRGGVAFAGRGLADPPTP